MPKRKRKAQDDARYWRDVAALLQQMREQDRRIEELLRRGDELLRRLKARTSATACSR